MPNIPKYTLAIETSTQKGSLSLLKDGAEVQFWAGEKTPSISSALLPQISDLLSKNSIGLNDLGLIAASIGPGSFTGTRIGLSTAKALQSTLNIPSIGVSLLEALAWSVKDDTQKPLMIAAFIPAGRTEVYWQEFRIQEARLTTASPISCQNIEDMPGLLTRVAIFCVSTNDLKPEHIEFLEQETGSKVTVAGNNLAKCIGEVAINKAIPGQEGPQDSLHPIYVKEAFSGPGK